MARLPKVKLRAIPAFPSKAIGGSGIDVAKANGIFSISLDVSDFHISGVATPDTLTTYAISWGGVTTDNPGGSFQLVPYAGFQSASSELSSLAELGTLGLVARIGDADYVTRTLAAGTGLAVTNGDGVAGNPTVAINDAELLALAGVTSAADRLFYFTGLGTGALATFTTFGRSLVDDPDAATARATLGLSSVATAAPAALTKTDDTNVTLALGGTPATALLQATSITVGWTGTLAASRGGFGADVSASSGVPLFAAGVATFTGTTGTGNFARATSPTFVTPALGTPSALVLTNATGLPTTGLTGTLQAAQEPAHTGDVTNTAGSLALAIGATRVTSAMLNADVFSTAHSWGGQQTFVAPILGTPASGVATNLTGTAAGLTAGNVTTNANLTGAVTSVGNATSLGSFTSANLATALTDETGSGAAVFSASPALTGTPTAPTAAVDTNTTQLATTAMVLAQAASATPLIDGTATVGTSTRYARGDHIHPTDTTRAALVSPSFTTPSLGVATATSINGVTIDNSAWTAYTPAITSQGGALTSTTITATGRYKQIGKTVFLQVQVVLTSIGSGSPTGGVRATVPVTQTPSFSYVGSSAEVALTGKSGAAFLSGSNTYVSAADATNTTYWANGNTVVMTLTYEAA